MRTKLVLVVASLLVVTGVHAQAPDRSGAPQPSSKPAASKPSALTSKEIKIVNHLHADNRVDMEAGRLATISAADSGVREFKTRELKALIAKLVPLLELHLECSKKLQFDQS